MGRWCCGLAFLWAMAQSAAAQTTNYFFPHLSVGSTGAGTFQTTLTYINYSPQAVTCTTNFLSDSGAPLLVPFGATTVSSRTDTMAAGGSVHVETTAAANAPLSPGWARATCSGPVKASLLFRLYSGTTPVGEAGVNATTTPVTQFVSFAERKAGAFGTGVAYANPSTQSALITFTARDSNGQTLATTSRNLGPGGHDARGVSELFSGVSFTGSVLISSTVAIVSLSLNFEADPVFSSLPPSEIGAPSAGPFEYNLPHLAVGARWQTTLTYINVSNQAVSCTTNFQSDSGGSLAIPFGGAPASSRTDNLAVGGSVHVETTADVNAPLSPGWARVLCNGEIKASLLFRLYSGTTPVAEAGVNASATPTSKFVSFAEVGGVGKFGTGVALATAFPFFPVVCTVSAFNQAGTRVVAPAGVLLFGPSATLHTAFNLGGPGGAFTAAFAAAGITSFVGSIHVVCSPPVVVSLQLNFEADPVISSLPPGDLDSATLLAGP